MNTVGQHFTKNNGNGIGNLFLKSFKAKIISTQVVTRSVEKQELKM